MTAPCLPNPRHAQIVAVVCEMLNVELNDVLGTGRHADVIRARELVVWTLREMTGASYPEIGAAMGRKFHSTALEAYRRYQRNPNPGFERTVREVLVGKGLIRDYWTYGGATVSGPNAERFVRESGIPAVRSNP